MEQQAKSPSARSAGTVLRKRIRTRALPSPLSSVPVRMATMRLCLASDARKASEIAGYADIPCIIRSLINNKKDL